MGVIDSLSITEYETKDGRLVKVNSKPGFYNIIPSEAILSKKTTIFGENIQVTGRSCEVREDIITEVEPTGDFLSDKLLFKFNGTIKLTEVCRTSNGVVTSKWSFENEIYIDLPISCSISSKQINCGDQYLLLDPHRSSIRRSTRHSHNIGDMHQKITEQHYGDGIKQYPDQWCNFCKK